MLILFTFMSKKFTFLLITYFRVPLICTILDIVCKIDRTIISCYILCGWEDYPIETKAAVSP